MQRKTRKWAGEATQRVRSLLCKPENLSSNPESHGGKKESAPQKLFWHPHTCCPMQPLPHTHRWQQYYTRRVGYFKGSGNKCSIIYFKISLAIHIFLKQKSSYFYTFYLEQIKIWFFKFLLKHNTSMAPNELALINRLVFLIPTVQKSDRLIRGFLLLFKTRFHYVAKAGLKSLDSPFLSSRAWGLQTWVTNPGFK